MRMSMEELEAAVRSQICGVCEESTVDGTCGREDPETCALFRLFPLVAEAILSTHSNDIRDYVEAIRQRVCTICRDQELDGSCEVRQQVKCALDAYLIPVVDVIEEATGRSFDRTVLGRPEGGIHVQLDSNQRTEKENRS